MWADNETSEDLLGFKIHADLIIDVLNDNTVLPITIGVFGDWGSGKSSILKIINDQLSGKDGGLKDNTLVLYFNGWLFEGYDDAKAALLESIIEQFAEHKTIGNKVKDSTTKLLKSVKWMRVLGLGFKKIVLPATSAYLTGGISLIPYLAKEFSELNSDTLIDKLKGNDSESFLSGLINRNEEDETKLVRTFRSDFTEMIEKSDIEKLVVIIDDLDRCTPERLIENLEAIKLFLNVDKTAFIIGADPRIVKHAIEFRYKTDRIENASDLDTRNERIVSDYLEKLIQLPYTLPKLSDHEVETYMTLLFCKNELSQETFIKVLDAFKQHQLHNRYGVYGFGNIQALITDEERANLTESVSLIASLSSIITEGLNGNPRQIKRFLNTFMLRKRLVDIAGIQNFKVDILIKLMVLEYSKLGLFKKIYEWQNSQEGEPKELAILEKLAQQKDNEKIKTEFDSDWSSEKIIRWLNVEPKLSNSDLRDYFWISRDQLSKSIDGSSLIPPHLRILARKLIEHGSGSILAKIVTEEISKLDEQNIDTLLNILTKELIKMPENVKIHKVFIELISKNIVGSLLKYSKVIQQIDNNKIPFSLKNDYTLAEKFNPEIKTLYKLFKNDTSIYRAFNPKK
jgi:hypothetical protein